VSYCLKGLPIGAALIALSLLGTGCVTAVRVPPAKPLPVVKYISPDDPDAVIALSAEAEIHLKQRDQLQQDRIRALETLLQPE